MIDELFLADMRRRELRPAYLTSLRQTLGRLQRDVGPLETVTADQIQAWFDLRPIGPGQRAAQHAHLSTFYRWAVDHGHLPGPSPMDLIVRPRVKRGLPRPIDEDDLARALAHADRQMRLILRLGAYAGFRAGEVAQLRGEAYRRGELLIENGKGGKSRVVPAHPSIQVELAAWPSKGWLFTKQDGTPWRGNRVSQAVGDHFRDLGIDATFHQCRHRFATELLRVSGNLLLVSRLLGHARLEETLVYAQLTATGADEVAQMA